MTEPIERDVNAENAPEPTHVVTGPMVIVPTPNGQQVYIYEGGVLPADLPDDEVDRLVESGLVIPITDLAERPEPPLEGQELIKSIIDKQPDRAGATSERSGGDVERADLSAGTTERTTQPSPAAPKADWVSYAVSQGYERSVAESLTKGELVDRLSAR